MYKIATHDSATGEKGSDILSLLVTPFAMTQSKTISEQYDCGCRMFDIRVRRSRHNNEWICAHGLWESKKTVDDILTYLNEKGDTYVTITYEGRKSNDFIDFINTTTERYKDIVFGGAAYKFSEGDKGCKNKYNYVTQYPKNWPPCRSEFKKLDGRSWHTYLPLPWLWKKLYYNKPAFNEDTYIYVDFL